MYVSEIIFLFLIVIFLIAKKFWPENFAVSDFKKLQIIGVKDVACAVNGFCCFVGIDNKAYQRTSTYFMDLRLPSLSAIATRFVNGENEVWGISVDKKSVYILTKDKLELFCENCDCFVKIELSADNVVLLSSKGELFFNKKKIPNPFNVLKISFDGFLLAGVTSENELYTYDLKSGKWTFIAKNVQDAAVRNEKLYIAWCGKGLSDSQNFYFPVKKLRVAGENQVIYLDGQSVYANF